MTKSTTTVPQQRGDVVFRTLVTGAGITIVSTLGAVATFLVLESLPALNPAAEIGSAPEGFVAYVTPLVFGTLLAATMALIFATPLAIGIGLFISHYAPRRIASVLGYIVDLLAAIPSVVYGLWGIQVLAPTVQPLYQWLNEQLGWLPFFEGPVSGTGRTILTVSFVLAIMILPIMSALAREIFLQTPTLQEEAALALGATRWEMIRMAVIPFAKSGLLSSAMLGLGRALGETMAVAMVLSPAAVITFALITPTNPSTIASTIALDFPEAAGLDVNALIAAGLVLFVITMAVNVTARNIITRNARKGAH
ncbi:MAG: phosphate transporter permease subunit PstC [Actinomycetota bacterium]|jgi:phosphate transport system permease protein